VKSLVDAIDALFALFVGFYDNAEQTGRDNAIDWDDFVWRVVSMRCANIFTQDLKGFDAPQVMKTNSQ